MKSRSGLLAAAVALTVAVPAFAQTPMMPGGAQTGQLPEPPAPAEPPPPAGAQNGATIAPATGPKKDAPPSTPMAGYAYSDKAPVARAAVRARARGPAGPAVNMPGFEPLGDGGSRLFVQLSQTVPVEERRAAGSITYVLKGASPRVWNNTNALVTVHFNTPVARARLVPQGRDLLFIIELRAAATPVWKVSDAPDKGAILAIDFPKGDYLDANGQPIQSATPAAAPDAPAAKPVRGGGRRGRGTPPPSNAAGPKP